MSSAAGPRRKRFTRTARYVGPARRIASALLCGSCPSARRFPLAFLHPVDCPSGVGFGWIVGSCYHEPSSYKGRVRRAWRPTTGV
jgi:hypothetical protein